MIALILLALMAITVGIAVRVLIDHDGYGTRPATDDMARHSRKYVRPA